MIVSKEYTKKSVRSQPIRKSNFMVASVIEPTTFLLLICCWVSAFRLSSNSNDPFFFSSSSFCESARALWKDPMVAVFRALRNVLITQQSFTLNTIGVKDILSNSTKNGPEAKRDIVIGKPNVRRETFGCTMGREQKRNRCPLQTAYAPQSQHPYVWDIADHT